MVSLPTPHLLTDVGLEEEELNRDSTKDERRNVSNAYAMHAPRAPILLHGISIDVLQVHLR